MTVVDVGFGGFRALAEQRVGERGQLLHLRRLSNDFKRHTTGAYTTGIMVRVAWAKESDGVWEVGLYLPEAPGSMRISWFRELLEELGFNEREIFSKRVMRRHRCRLPCKLLGAEDGVPIEGVLLDLSPGGGLFGSSKKSILGQVHDCSVKWGLKELVLKAEVVGLRVNNIDDMGPRWLHSLRFQSDLDKTQEQVLHGWLEELARNA